MTIEIFEPAPVYQVQNTGPYAVPHPYETGALRLAVISDGEISDLLPSEYTVTPERSAEGGAITLGADTLAAHQGAQLTIWRETPEEQGWVGILGEREKGLEIQLDRIVMILQELRAGASRTVRVTSPIATFAPSDGSTIIFQDGQPVEGPDLEYLGRAESFAERAEEAARLLEEAMEWGDLQPVDLPALLASQVVWPVGAVIETKTEGYRYQVVPAGAIEADHVTVGGTGLKVLARDGVWPVDAFIPPGADDCATYIQRAAGRASAAGEQLRFGARTYVTSQISSTGPAHWVLDAGAVLRRHPDTITGSWIIFAAPTTINGGEFDGNRAGTTTGCHNLRFNIGANRICLTGLKVRGAKSVSAGWGAGISISVGQSDDQRHMITGCDLSDNDGNGLHVLDARYIDVHGNRAFSNGLPGYQGSGLYFNNFDQTFAQKIVRASIMNNECYFNTGSGIGVGNMIEDNDLSKTGFNRVYSHENFEAIDITIAGNTCSHNAIYGIAAFGRRHAILNNTVRFNGTPGNLNGGILVTCDQPSTIGNVIEYNTGFGIDHGACVRGRVIGNSISNNTVTGITVEGNTLTRVVANTFENNGASDSYQIVALWVGGDGLGGSFNGLCNNCVIKGNTVISSAQRGGVMVEGGTNNITVTENDFKIDDPGMIHRVITDYGRSTVVENNIINYTIARTVALSGNASASVLYVPDVFDRITVTEPGWIIEGIRTHSQLGVGNGLAYIEVTAAGGGYTSNPTVTITGGGGSGATAVAQLWKGTLLAVRITNRGSGYTSNPTVTITGGGGSGAAAVASAGLPLRNGRSLEILFTNGATIRRNGSVGPIVEGGGGDIVVPVDGSITLRSFSGQWRLISKSF